ncbi:MAG: hypothetical protein R3264_20005 [Anaerolineae bacterium]|nr:hypothetical protein [Anaerolineae bacterium]
MGLAARGSRNMDSGEEKIEVADVLAQVSRQARRVHLQTLVSTAALTALGLVIPYGT